MGDLFLLKALAIINLKMNDSARVLVFFAAVNHVPCMAILYTCDPAFAS